MSTTLDLIKQLSQISKEDWRGLRENATRWSESEEWIALIGRPMLSGVSLATHTINKGSNPICNAVALLGGPETAAKLSRRSAPSLSEIEEFTSIANKLIELGLDSSVSEELVRILSQSMKTSEDPPSTNASKRKRRVVTPKEWKKPSPYDFRVFREQLGRALENKRDPHELQRLAEKMQKIASTIPDDGLNKPLLKCLNEIRKLNSKDPKKYYDDVQAIIAEKNEALEELENKLKKLEKRFDRLYQDWNKTEYILVIPENKFELENRDYPFFLVEKFERLFEEIKEFFAIAKKTRLERDARVLLNKSECFAELRLGNQTPLARLMNLPLLKDPDSEEILESR